MIPLPSPTLSQAPLPCWLRTAISAAALLAVATPGRAAQLPGNPAPPASPAAVSTSAPSPAGGRIPDDRLGLQVAAKFISLTRAAVLRLQQQETRDGGPAKGLADHLAAIFAGPAPAAGGSAPTNFLVSQVLHPNDWNALVHTLNKMEGVDLLSSPRVTSKSGQKATVEITREVIYPVALDRATGPDRQPMLTPTKFDKKNTGVTLTVEGSIAPARDAVDLNIAWQLVNLGGFLRTRDGEAVPVGEPAKNEDLRPVFTTQAIDTFVTMPPGDTLVLGTLRQHPGNSYNDASPAPAPPGEEAIVLTFVTPTLAELRPPEADPASPSPKALEPPAAKASDLPYARPVPNKPGFVTSPYAPDAGYVDLHGFERGQQVRDPYTGKLFLVP